MSKMEIAEGSRREEGEAGMLFTQVRVKDKNIRMGVCDQFLHDLTFDFFSFQLFSCKEQVFMVGCRNIMAPGNVYHCFVTL